jgi:hypothetical protein
MSRYVLIRRLRGPVFLLLVGILALLAQAHIFSLSKSWPICLIFWGVISLVERVALSKEGGYQRAVYPGACCAPASNQTPGAPYPESSSASAASQEPSSQPEAALVPAPLPELAVDSQRREREGE